MGVDFKTHPWNLLFLKLSTWVIQMPFITYLMISVPILSANAFATPLLCRDLPLATSKL